MLFKKFKVLFFLMVLSSARPALVSHTSGWLKDSARENVLPMFVTELVSQASSELKALARKNVVYMLVTRLVSQASGLLNAGAYMNVFASVVTLLVSHLETSPLKSERP